MLVLCWLFMQSNDFRSIGKAQTSFFPKIRQNINVPFLALGYTLLIEWRKFSHNDRA